VNVPCALPAWLDGNPLAAIARQLELGDGATGRELLLRLVRERDGALLLPPHSELANVADPPWRVLAQWAGSLPAPARERLRLDPALAERELGSGPIDAASPLLWLDGLDALALRRLEEAIEAGDRDAAALLLRRPGLAERLHPTPRAWVSRPERERGRPDPEPPESLRTGARFSLDLEANPLDGLEERPLPASRRLPLADIHPAIIGSSAIIPGRPGPFLLELAPPHRRLATLPPPYAGESAAPGPLRDIGWYAAAMGTVVALPLRTPKSEYGTTVEWIHDPSPWRDRGWTEPGLFSLAEMPPAPLPRSAGRIAESGLSVGGAPLIDGDLVVWIATRGFGEVETWLVAADLASGEERWRTHLGTISPPWQSMGDLRGLLPEGRIVPRDDELFVIHGGGWVARVGRARGDLRGALLYARRRETPALSPKWGLHHFARLPALRPRYLGDAWVDESSGRPRLIALPPDARHVIAIDLEEWRIAWTHPTTEAALLRRDEAGNPWIIDLRTEPGERTVRVETLDAATARRRTASVELEIPRVGPDSPRPLAAGEPDPEDYAPLLAGVPSLAGGWLALPVEAGWALWRREPLAGGPPDRLIRWPSGCPGGTMVPAGEGRWLAVHRAEATWQSRSTVEILESAGTAEPAGEEKR